MFSMLRGLRTGCCLLPILFVLTPVVLVVAFALALFRGSPGACGGGRGLNTDPALAAAYDERWGAFNDQILRGLPASIAVSEDEATAKSRIFLALTGAPIDDVRICFNEGGGDVNGTLSTPFGGDIAVRLRGTVDMTKATPDAKLTSVRIGALPGFVTKPFDRLISRVVDDQLEQIILFHDMTAEIHEGEAVITGRP